MATTLQVRKAIADGIRTGIPSLKDCREFHGDFSPEHLRSVIVQTPAVLVSALDRGDLDRQASQATGSRDFAALVIAGGPDPDLRNNVAIALVDALELLVEGCSWGLADAGGATNVRSKPVYAEGSTYALWLILWAQPYDLDPVIDPATLENLLRLCGEISQADGDPDAPTIETRNEFTP